QEGAVRGAVRSRGPDALAGDAAPHSGVHREAHRPALGTVRGGEKAALGSLQARRIAGAISRPSSSPPPPGAPARRRQPPPSGGCSELIAWVADTESDSVVDAPVITARRWVASAESNECASPCAGGSVLSLRVESSCRVRLSVCAMTTDWAWLSASSGWVPAARPPAAASPAVARPKGRSGWVTAAGEAIWRSQFRRSFASSCAV